MSAPGKEAPGHWLKRSGGGEGGIFSRKGYVCVQGNSKRSYNYISNRSSHWQIEGEETKVWSTNLRRESIAIFNKWADCCTFGPFLGPNDSFRLLSHHILCTTTAGIKNSDSLSLTLTFYRTYGSLCISTAVASGGLSKRVESIDRVMRRSPKHHQCQECPVSQHCCSKFLCSQLVGYRRSAAWVCVYRCQQEAERGGTPTSIM